MPLPGQNPKRRASRGLGYRPRTPRTPPPKPRRRRPLLADVAAWLAATAVAGSLLVLLAFHDPLIAAPVVLGYLAFSWLLWSTRR